MVWRRLTRLQQQGLKVQDLINQDLGGWNSNLIKEIFEEPIAMKILQTPVGITGEKDNLIWPHSTSGDFSIKTGYHAARAEAQLESTTPNSSHRIPEEVWKVIWENRVPQKIKLFFWKACNNALPVMGNLLRRRIARDGVCPICQSKEETVEHAILLCP